MKRGLFATAAVLLAGTAGCGEVSPTALDANPAFAHLDGGSCQAVKGTWTASGNPMTGEFSGVIEGGLEGTTSTFSQVVPPGFTGKVAHGVGTHTIELDGGPTLNLESHWTIANGRLNASYTVVAGGHGSLTAHGVFNPSDLVLRYNGSICS